MNKTSQSAPIKISTDIFKVYHYVSFDQEQVSKNTGLFIEDGLFEISFIKEKDIKLESAGQLFLLPQCFSTGRVDLPAKFVIPKQMTFFTIKIQPWVTDFFCKNDSHPIQDLSKSTYPDILKLHAKLFSGISFKEQIKHVENFFLNQELPDLCDFQISKQICEHIYENKGDIKIKTLLSSFPYSRQKLNRLFLTQTKNSIKEFAIFVRLRAIMSYHMKHPEESLTSISYKFGYADQSHFIKDMKKVSGITPSKFSKTFNLFFDQIDKPT